jgi:uncharacterized protein YfiM (DUF2279 family)
VWQCRLNWLLALALLLVQTSVAFAQQGKFSRFVVPADTLIKSRVRLLHAVSFGAGATSLIGLNQLWYANYPRSSFHLINDNQEWLSMDKCGHFSTTYSLAQAESRLFRWTGTSRKKSALIGGAYALGFLTTVEVLDGLSAEWGFSWGDMTANASGVALYSLQEAFWQRQVVVPKWSFHQTQYAHLRPGTLGKGLHEEWLKDYNGQTYWLSVCPAKLGGKSKWPAWLAIAGGYGAEGLVGGSFNPEPYQNIARQRQLYLSLDINWLQVKTGHRFFDIALRALNFVKVPAPTLEWTEHKGLRGYFLYF